MKKTRKIIALVISMMVMMSMAMTVNAASITMNNNLPTGGSGAPTYTYYQILEAEGVDTSTTPATASYYVSGTTKKGILESTGLFNFTPAGSDRWNVTQSESDAETIASTLGALTEEQLNNFTHGTFTGTADGLTDGYYLIKSSLGTAYAVRTLGDVTVNEKNSYPDLTKTVNPATAEIGETVTYTLAVTIPTSAAGDIVLYDNIDNGLTMNTAISGISGGLTWQSDSSYNETGRTGYKVTIPAATVANNLGQTLNLTYTATVNAGAAVGTDLSNTGYLNYNGFNSNPSTANVKTFAFSLEKVDGSNHDTKLENVIFTLTNEVGNYYTADANPRFNSTAASVSTNSYGTISFVGLHAGTYTLTETSTNAGYNLLSTPITVTVDSNGAISASGCSVSGTTLTIENNKGTVLPSTGGIGTTIFYVVGLIAVLGAGIFLVTNKRMAKEDI